MAGRLVLALNCGSSSLKFGIFRAEENDAHPLCTGEAEEIGKQSTLTFATRDGRRVLDKKPVPVRDHADALARAFEAIDSADIPKPDAVGHRLVHGGPQLTGHQVLTPEGMRKLQDATNYAPLHMPASLAVVRASEQKLPGTPQVICLDTAFHRDMPPVSQTYPLPAKVREHGIRRYGFHGLSIESILAQMREVPARLIVAHLGNGSSITAIQRGKSVDTTMGMTPSGGVMMGTRTGDLDPGLMIFLQRHGFSDAAALEKLIDRESGLFGVSGLTSDVRELSAQRKTNKEAGLALAMFCYQVRKAIAGMVAALGGVDCLVFSGGIGEHAGEVRDEICSGLQFLHIPQTLILPAQEEIQIARITARLV